MPDPVLKIRATEELLAELVAAHSALKRSRGAGPKEAPKLDALIVQLYRVRQAELAPAPSAAP